MINPPRTKEEAKKRRYGGFSHFGYSSNTAPFDRLHCAHETNPPLSEGLYSYQCSRKPGHGPDGLYCKQHAKIVNGKDVQ